jgi:1-deoxy-D-xylulose-5-phosphate synthase
LFLPQWDQVDLRNLMYTAQLPDKGPFSIRYPRGNGPLDEWKRAFQEIPVGKGRKISEGDSLAVLSIGHAGNLVVEAAEMLKREGISFSHYDMRFVVPVDQEILDEVAARFDTVITVEDGVVDGGFGSMVAEYFSGLDKSISIKRLGVPSRFVEHGTQEELYRECGFDASGIRRAVHELINRRQVSL